jgi:hypothetical protein
VGSFLQELGEGAGGGSAVSGWVLAPVRAGECLRPEVGSLGLSTVALGLSLRSPQSASSLWGVDHRALPLTSPLTKWERSNQPLP